MEEDVALPGFIRLKTLAAGAEPWQEYADAAGRLRRDLVKAKLANLLATAIKRGMYLGNLQSVELTILIARIYRSKGSFPSRSH